MKTIWVCWVLASFVQGGEWDVWICGRYDLLSASWLWPCDNALSLAGTYAVWATNAPPPVLSDGMVVYMSDAEAFAYGVKTETEGVMRFMCEIEQEECPSGYGRIIYGSTHCWKLKGKLPSPTWAEARADCQGEGGDLASINSQAEFEAIQNWLMPYVPAPAPAPTSAPTTKEQTTIMDTILPDTTGPETTVPDTTVPDTTVPDTTVPDTIVPDTTVPDTTVPDTTVPDTTVPDTIVPDTTVPDTTVPDTTIPDSTVPNTIVPDTAVLDTTFPDTTLPDTTFSIRPDSTTITTTLPDPATQTTRISTTPATTIVPTTKPGPSELHSNATVQEIKMPMVNKRACCANAVDQIPVSPPQPLSLDDFLRTAPPPMDSQVENVDERASAIAIGVSWLFMCLVFAVFLCVLDSTTWYKACGKFRRNIRHITKKKRI